MFAYEVSRVYAKTVKEEKVDEKGKKFTIEKEEDVDEIVEVYLKRPTRRLYDECNLFYSVKVSEGIKEGLLTRAMLSKRYRDDKGALSDEEKEALNLRYEELLGKEKEFQVIQLNLADVELSLEERQERLDKLVKDIESLKSELESFEFAAESLYEHTSEARASRLTNMWWLLNLTFFKANDSLVNEYIPFFKGKDFEEKMGNYSLLEERILELDNKYSRFESAVIEKSAYLLAAWNSGNVKTFDDFERVETSLTQIQDEIQKDDSLQVIYEQRVRELAGLEIEMGEREPEEKPEKELKEEPKEESKEAPVSEQG